jgi:uncharacterized protein YjdB
MAISVSVLPTTANLSGPGSTQTIVPTVTGGTLNTVTWSSGTPAVATVTSSGVVHFVKAGTATITALSTDDGTTNATCVITCKAVITVAEGTTATALVGSHTQLHPSEAGSASAPTFTYTRTSGSGSGTVSGTGLYEALGAGTDVITIADSVGGNNATSVTYTATVSEALPGGTARILVTGPHSNYLQNLLNQRLQDLKSVPSQFYGSGEQTLILAILANLRAYGSN